MGFKKGQLGYQFIIRLYNPSIYFNLKIIYVEFREMDKRVIILVVMDQIMISKYIRTENIKCKYSIGVH